MAKIPSIESLFAAYPTGSVEEVAVVVGGDVAKNLRNLNYPAYKDTCAIRVSRALNYGGDPIPFARNIDVPQTGGKVRYDMGGDKMRYIYSTYDIRAYLNVRYGRARKFPGTATESDVAGVIGIIAFGFYHIDLWDGGKCAGHAYFGVGDVTKENVWVWETFSKAGK
ncbi:MAG: type VI secretion system amidase effector protein Tae4 [Acidobacteriota bacterium]|nr:type VI secretion system amidase effector protein Tae4 [Acidobacteriota bacterium]